MTLIADSGSTKTDWVLMAPDGQIVGRQTTEGINPFHQAEEDIADVLRLVDFPLAPANIYFYGSGLRPEVRPAMQRLLAARFPAAASIEAENDLLGAARALCGHEEGVACILGTGANSCLYDGEQIVQNTPPLGYILGDEGSGAVLGRHLLNGLYKGTLPLELREAFEREQNMTLADVVERVYRQPMANRWLASLSKFIYKYMSEYQQLSNITVECFCEFLRKNVLPYARTDLKVSATGSIAWFYQAELGHAAALEGLHLGRVEQSPMAGLLRYHQA